MTLDTVFMYQSLHMPLKFRNDHRFYLTRKRIYLLNKQKNYVQDSIVIYIPD